jgi:hypothetical protein
MHQKVRGPLLGYGKPALAMLVIAMVLVSMLIAVTRPARQAVAVANNAINFQARLMTNGGSIVADGYYNVEFKLYNVSSGGSALWTETWYDSNGVTAGNDNRVRVQNGYLTVSLGTQNAFPGTINWEQQLWITMNIGGVTQTATPTWDGEMTPRLLLTAVPYAFRAQRLASLNGSFNGVLEFASSFGQDTTITLPDPGAGTATVCYQGSTSCGFATGTTGSFIQNGTSVQTNANFNIRSAAIGSVGAVVQGANGQTADLLQLQSWNGTTATNVFSVNNSGVATLNGGQTIDITTATAATANGLTLQPGVSSGASSTGGALSLKGGDVSGTTAVTGGAITVQGGNATGGSGTRNGGSVTIDGGTGATTAGSVSIGTTNSTTINVGSVGSTAKATTIHIGDTTTTTGGAIQAITIGSNSNLAHTTVIQGGSGNTAGSEAIRLVPQTTGGIAIGSTTGTGTITLGQSTAANTINIGNANFTAANAQTINIANGTQTTAASTLSVNILSGAAGSSGTARLNLANSDRVTQVDIGNVGGSGLSADAARTLNLFTGAAAVVDTINIGTGAATVAGGKTIHIGDGTPTGSGTNLVTIGSIAALANTTTIQGGNGSGAVSVQAATSGTIAVGTTNANTVNIGSTAATTTTIRGGSGVNIGDGGTTGAIQVGNTTGGVAQTISIGTNATSSATNTINIGSGTTSSGTVTVNAGTGSGNLILLQSNNATGGTKIKSATNSTAAFLIQDSGSNSYLSADTVNATISIGYASSTTTLNGTVKVATLGSATGNSTIVCRDSVTTIITDCGTGGGAGTPFIQGGNSFAATAVLGTNDTNNLQFETNNTVRATFDQSNGLYVGNGVTAATPSNFTVAGTGSSTAGTAGAQLSINGGAGATSTTGSVGGALALAGGAAGGSGNNDGGNVTIQGGAGVNAGAKGSVILQSGGGSVGIGVTPNTAYKLDVNGNVNIASGAAYSINGANLNTAGTLSNVAYLDQNNTFTGANTIAPTAASAIALTVKGTTGTAAHVMDIYNSNASPTLQAYFDATGSLNVSQVIQPTSNNAIDVGLSGTAFRTGYFGTSVVTPLVSSTGTLSVQGVTSVGISTTSSTAVSTGAITIQSGNATVGSNLNAGTITIDTGTKTGTGTAIVNVGSTNAVTLQVGNGSSTTTISGTVKLSTLSGVTANSQVVCRDTSTNTLTSCDSGAGGLPFVQGGNSFGATAILGTNDANNLQFETNNVKRATLDQSNNLYLGLGVTDAAPTAFTVQGTGSATAGTTGAQLNVQGGAGATTGAGSVGGVLAIAGGAAGGSGNNNGGNVTIQGGAGVNSGVRGSVVLQGTSGSVGIGVTPNTAYKLDVAGDINISTGSKYRINGADINTGGTLTNVAYLDQNNAFTGKNTFSRNSTGTGDYSLGVTGTPINDATSSLVRVGGAIAGGNAAANGGTYIGINTPSSGAGSTADFFDFQANGTIRAQLTNAGNLTVGGTYNTNTFTSSGLQFGAGSTATVQSAAGQALNVTGHATSAISTDAGDLGVSAFANLNLGNSGGTAINIGTNNAAHTIGIGNTGATGAQAITIGGTGNTANTVVMQGGTTASGVGAVSIQAASAGLITIGTTNSNPVTIGGASSTVTVVGTVKLTTALGAATANANSVCRDSSTTNLINCDANTTGRPFLQGGNSFAATGLLGTNDANNLQIETNAIVRATFDQSNALYLGLGATNAAPTAFTVAATSSTTAGTAGAAMTIQGGAGASTTTGSAGGNLTLAGGNSAGGSGNNAGGIVTLQGGTATNTGTAGYVLVKNSQNSATAFVVQDTGSAALFTAATGQRLVMVGTTQAGTSTTTPAFMYLSDIPNNAPGNAQITGQWASTANWGLGPNSNANDSTLRFGVTTGNPTATAGNVWSTTANVNLLVAGTLKVNPTTGNNSTSAFQVQQASAGNVVFDVDTTNSRVGIGTAAPTYDLSFGGAANRVLSMEAQGTSNTAGNSLTVRGSAGNGTGLGGGVTVQGGTGGATGAGGVLTLQGGTGGGGNTNGGNVAINGGTPAGTGVTGLVVINTPTFQTSSTQTCTGTPNPCVINQTDIDGNGAVVITASTSSVNVTLNDPSLAASAKGRILYVTAALGSNDFTLVVNGGGTGNQIAMRANTTATMIWNGTDWTAAGASSSTTLQAAYDNTLTSAGGAELVLSNTANANGLTIRDSSTNSVNGTLLEVQSSTAANLFSVNSNVTDYATDAGAETAGGSSTTFPASTWSAVGSASTSRYITAGNFIATGIASVSTTTTNVTNDGVKNQLSTTLTANNHYNVSFATRLTAGQTFTSLQVYYSIDGTTAGGSLVQCTTGKTVATSVWTKINCAFTAPSSGITSSNAIIIRQSTAAIRTFYVDNLSVTIAADFNLATDGGVDDNTNFATNWSTAGLGTVAVTRNTSDGNDASDSAQANVTAGATNAGLRNKLSINPLAGASGTLYRVSVYAKLNSGAAFTDFKVRYSRDGGTNFVDCVDYNTQTVVTGAWTQITCYITTDNSAPSSPYVYFVEAASGVRNYSVDTFSMTLAQNTTPNVQIGGGLNGGPVTLFTLDRGASAPIAANNDSMLGSMYYDTTLGKLQCYEADGWGACGSSPDNIVTISPEYTNAVLHGTGIGTMTSDLCSDGLNVNDGSSGQATICGSNETYNFYRWTSPQASPQTYSIYVTYQLPTTFKTFQSGTTSVMGRTDSSSSTVQYSVYRNSGAGLSQCGSTVSVSTGSVSSWQPGPATGAADPSTCGFAGGNSIVFKIDVIASVNANAYVGNLGFTYTNQ